MGKKLNFDSLLKHHFKVLKSLRYPSGLFSASSKKVSTGYDKAWVRDNFYECLAFLVVGDWGTISKTYRSLLDIFLKHESKIDWAIENKPTERFQYIHARFHPETFDEFWEEWGNKQNDSIGAILFMLGLLSENSSFLFSKSDLRIIQKLVWYLRSIEYWHDFDSGMWEENEEVHASSVGACVAGLLSVKKIKGISVPDDLISKGKKSLIVLLPRESEKKFVDLSLLSLILPYNVVPKATAKVILDNVEYHLVRRMGVLRYKNDYYYNKNVDGFSEEAEWTFGFSWLAIIFDKLNNKSKANFYFRKSLETINSVGEIPELYFSNSSEFNDNSPLGWSESLFLVALLYLHSKHANFKL